MPHPSLDYLDGLALHGIKLGLANIRALLTAAGEPQDAYPTIHIGGTNGKGSTVAMLGAILTAAGLRVGRFTSPHLVKINERFQIGDEIIPDEELFAEIEYFRRIAAERDYPPTFFELNTAVAFRWFARRQVDAAIIEVGLGGRLDSTNVIRPVATAVTSIDLDHMQYLGDTLEEIAYEKAGIFKPGVPAVISELKEGPRGVLLARARQEGAPSLLLGHDFTFALSGHPLEQRITYHGPGLALREAPLGLHGTFQGPNAATAVTLALACARHLPGITPEAIRRGLAGAKWPCRLERVSASPPVYIDVAHNPAGAARLATHFERYVLVLAVSADKDAAAMLAHLAPRASAIVTTAYAGPRAMAPEALAALARQAAPGAWVESTHDLDEALSKALPRAHAALPLLITGSIFLAGEASTAARRALGG